VPDPAPLLGRKAITTGGPVVTLRSTTG
jgi:hypothetical protein